MYKYLLSMVLSTVAVMPAQAEPLSRLTSYQDESIVTDLTPLESISLDADELLKRSDMARGGNIDGIRFNAELTSYKEGEEVNSFSMLIEAAGDDNLVSFTAPARSRGISILVRSRNMWFLSPTTKRPVPISPRQRLLGEANNGDIATTNYSRDYDAVVIGEAKVKGIDSYVLWLNAKEKNVTYQQVRYYIAKDSHLALKSDFFTASDKMIKYALMSYGNTITLPDSQLKFIDEMKVYDAIRQDSMTIMKYFDIEARTIPASRFDRRTLMQG
ncbi:outer membrane lipoprotein-sorting protein [Photobacterium satsumensis]|uniref:outer membrane lipoprotein-sorting protein n=1 Tax=Photobacterium satsumensis TaxID=2910239 RepID=UPI003D12FB42